MKKIVQLVLLSLFVVQLHAQSEKKSLVIRYVSGYLELSDSLKIDLLQTPQLSYSLSPNGFIGLPGLVLATERIYNGIRTATIAQSINPENRKLTKPTKGLPISQKEYDDLLVLWGLKEPD